MSNQQEETDTGSVSSSASCEQADSEAEPTPAPWVARERENGDYDVEDVPGAVSITGQVRSNTGAFSAEAKANAELIAAAPDLLEAARWAREYVEHPKALEVIEEAIAKAEGET